MRHIHVHLHPHGSAAATDQTPNPLSTKTPSTTTPRPPSTVIKPAPQSPHRVPSPNRAQVKPQKPTGVIKPQKGTSAPAPRLAAPIKAVRGVTSLVNTANRIASQRDSGTSEGARKAAATRKSGGAAQSSKVVTNPGFERRNYGAPERAAARRAANRDPNSWRSPPSASSDAGTSEGARKAAQTRKSGARAQQPFDASKHQNMAQAHYEHLAFHGKESGGSKSSPHYEAAKLHSEAAYRHNHAAGTGVPKHAEAAHAATKKANAASQSLGHKIYGTSE